MKLFLTPRDRSRAKELYAKLAPEMTESQRNILRAGLMAIVGIAISKSAGAKSYLGQSNLPRSMRNNNPGNIVMSGITWKGKLPASENTDGHFEQFENWTYGTRALILNLKSYIQDGFNTPWKIAKRWAPAGDGNNDPHVYAKHLADQLGTDIYDVVQLTYDDIYALSRAISEIEAGKNGILTGSDFTKAWQQV